VNIFLGGHVQIDIRAGRSAQAQLELADLRMDVRHRPAPAVRTPADEPE
jgi:hypothetical protein